mmetsp:Transcript_19340/g.13997  ORF Transcript_19340/g.13997 Transcript_19340/m.13997 type:complete len:82 (+) Transcript_19340:226-471(+)
MYVKHDCHLFGMEKRRIAGDGVVCAQGLVNGRLVYSYGYDFTVLGGTVSYMQAKKVGTLMEKAMLNGAPLVQMNDCGGARI